MNQETLRSLRAVWIGGLIAIAGALAVLVTVMIVIGCAGGPASQTEKAPVMVAAEALENFGKILASSMSDGTVTPEEAQAVSSGFQDLGGSVAIAFKAASGRTDWTAIVGAVISSVALSLIGVKIAPARALAGPFDKTA